MLQCWRQLSSDPTKKQGHSHLIGCGIISVTLRRFMWDWHQCETIICYSWSWLQAIAAPWKPWLFSSIKCCRNFTQLSLSSKLQCHLNGAVTMGPAFASCCLIMGGAFYSNLCTTRPIQCDAEPSGVCHHHCLSVNLKHVTCGRPLSVLLRTCRLVELKCLCSLFRPTYSVCDVCFSFCDNYTQYDASP